VTLTKERYPEYITVMERMTSKRIHYHLLLVVARIKEWRRGSESPILALFRGHFLHFREEKA